MGFRSLITNLLRPQPPVKAAKTSLAGPLIAWSHVGQPCWTQRRFEPLVEAGFRKNVIVYRCVMQIATAGAAIPWLLYDGEGELDQHPLLDLLRHPNPLQDGTTFLESIYAYLAIAGNAYIEAVTPRDGSAPVELYVLRPDRMKVIPGPTGLPQGYQYTVNGQVTTWSADPLTGASNILHLKQFHPLDDWYGMAPLEAAQVSIDQHNAAGTWNQALLSHGARPSGALVFAPKDGPSTLTDDQMHRLREELGQVYQGSTNAGRPLILEGGLDWREMSLSPKDMDWISGRNIAARDIALAFGVPAQLVGIPDAQTYANMAEARMALYEETILPLVNRVIAGFEHWLTPIYGDDLELDYDSDEVSALAVRRDTQWNKLQSTDFLTINEKRHAVGYGPIEGGDVLDSANKKPAAAPAQTPGAAPTSWPQAPFTSAPSAAPDAWSGEPKFNPNHDPDNGQFTFGSGGGDDDDDQPDDSGGGATAPDNNLNDGEGNNGGEKIPNSLLNLVNYSPDEPGWHSYVSGPNLICMAAQNCTPEEIADQLSRYAVPGQDPSAPVMNGQNYPVYDPETGIYVGMIKTQISSDGLIVINTTQPGHLLYDGLIVRGAYQGSNGAWYMLTYGFGNNTIPGMAELNQQVGPGIFRALDDAMRSNLARHR